MTGYEILPYEPALDPDCLELERHCPQGESYRLSFRRRTFRARSESYGRWRILLARQERQVVGTAAMALKPCLIGGKRGLAAFFYDARVHPGHRRRGITQELISRLIRESEAQGATFRYGYCVDDNVASRASARSLGGEKVAEYRYLVLPIYGRRGTDPQGVAREVTAPEVHRALLDGRRAPYEFYSDPFGDGRLQGWVGSLLGQDAGCSLWSNAGILEEFVERVPLPYRLARAALERTPLGRLPHPHIPGPGESLRSWYVHDFFAHRPGAAAGLARAIHARALERGIDFCYFVITDPAAEWVGELRRFAPRLFAPEIRYCMVAAAVDGPVRPIGEIYVDVRDL